MIPRPCSVSAIITCSGLAVAAKMRQPVDDARARQYLDGQAKDRALTPSEQRDLARLDLAGVTPEKAAQTLADPVALATAETWKDGSPAKIALHGMVGLIESTTRLAMSW